jgi:hypothetical protein
MPQKFKVFFSYSHFDEEADPRLILAFTEELQKRLNPMFVDGDVEVWRDTERLRLGDRWDAKIEGELRSSDILIVLLTPRWLGSDYCLKEYEIFEAVEIERAPPGEYVPSYVAPILARDIEKYCHG